MNDEWEMKIYLSELDTENCRVGRLERLYEHAALAWRMVPAFKICVYDDRQNSTNPQDEKIYSLEVSRTPGVPKGEDLRVTEQYFLPSSSWMDGDTQPVPTVITREHHTNEVAHPHSTAQLLADRATQLFTALQQRYPDIVQVPDHDYER